VQIQVASVIKNTNDYCCNLTSIIHSKHFPALSKHGKSKKQHNHVKTHVFIENIYSPNTDQFLTDRIYVTVELMVGLRVVVCLFVVVCNRCIVAKRCEIGPTLLLITNRKWHTGIQMKWKSLALNDLEGQYALLW